MTIVEFLLARIAEDEAVARDRGADAMIGHRWKHAPENVYQELQGEVLSNSRRALAECEAKRRIVAEAQRVIEWAATETDQEEGWVADGCERVMLSTLRALASVYADHEDYDAGWAL